MKPFFILVALLATIPALAQQGKDSAITAVYETEEADAFAINELLEISTLKYYIPATFSRYYCDLVIEEYREGQMVKRISIKDSLDKNFWSVLHIGEKLEKEKFPVRIYSQNLDSSLKLYIRIGGLGYNRRLPLMGDARYTWKEIYDIEKGQRPLKPGEKFPLVAYSTPVSAGHNRLGKNNAEFCLISGELIPVESWYKELGIKHFYLVSISLAE